MERFATAACVLYQVDSTQGDTFTVTHWGRDVDEFWRGEKEKIENSNPLYLLDYIKKFYSEVHSSI